ncbi:hypothetical protein SDC9_126076 [bioreactor metagenome]|uniref:Uncharacterized protein n=1 Tax=bioreactor metagenome TaxID=1076179 RepID=A0A645CQ65_9ZZZZ
MLLHLRQATFAPQRLRLLLQCFLQVQLLQKSIQRAYLLPHACTGKPLCQRLQQRRAFGARPLCPGGRICAGEGLIQRAAANTGSLEVKVKLLNLLLGAGTVAAF